MDNLAGGKGQLCCVKYEDAQAFAKIHTFVSVRLITNGSNSRHISLNEER
jgi:hypothetical protein